MQRHAAPAVAAAKVRLLKHQLGAAAKRLALAGLLVLASAQANLLAQDALVIDEQANVRIGRSPDGTNAVNVADGGVGIGTPATSHARLTVKGSGGNHPVAVFESPSENTILNFRNSIPANLAGLTLDRAGEMRLYSRSTGAMLVLAVDGCIAAELSGADQRYSRTFELRPALARFTTKVEVNGLRVQGPGGAKLEVIGNIEAEGNIRAKSISLPIYDVDIPALKETLIAEFKKGPQSAVIPAALIEKAIQALRDSTDFAKLFQLAKDAKVTHLLKYKTIGEKQITFVARNTNNDSGLFPYPNLPLPQPSDARLKSDVARIGGALGRLRKLSGVTFRWNDLGLDHLTRDAAAGVSAGPGATDEQNRAVRDIVRRCRQAELAGTNVGVLAQEVEAVLPEAVTTGEGGFKEVRYLNLIPLLVEAIKEQGDLVQDQARALRHRSEVAARQEREIARLQGQQRRLEGEIAGLRSTLTRLDQLEKRLARFENASPPDANGKVAGDTVADRISE